jgi:hypothetical protein
MFKKPLVEVLCDRTRIMAHPFAVQVSVPFKEETTINEDCRAKKAPNFGNPPMKGARTLRGAIKS